MLLFGAAVWCCCLVLEHTVSNKEGRELVQDEHQWQRQVPNSRYNWLLLQQLQPSLHLLAANSLQAQLTILRGKEQVERHWEGSEVGKALKPHHLGRRVVLNAKKVWRGEDGAVIKVSMEQVKTVR